MRTDRLRDLEVFIKNNHSASLKDICNKFNVSMNTVRRDISELELQGKITKVYGGIISNSEDTIIPFDARSISSVKEKQHIGMLCASIVSDDDTIYIDSGTTAVNIIPFISHLKNLTLVSNSLIVFNEIQKYPDIVLLSPGGIFNQKTKSFVGVTTAEELSNIRIKKAFMSATKVSISEGATNNSFHEAQIKRTVINHAQSVILVADHSKLDQAAAICFCELNRLSYFITDKKPPSQYIDYFKENNILLMY